MPGPSFLSSQASSEVSAQFMKILVHKCHVNRYNIVNQAPSNLEPLVALDLRKHYSGEMT